jgi:hypothetical protein
MRGVGWMGDCGVNAAASPSGCQKLGLSGPSGAMNESRSESYVIGGSGGVSGVGWMGHCGVNAAALPSGSQKLGPLGRSGAMNESRSECYGIAGSGGVSGVGWMGHCGVNAAALTSGSQKLGPFGPSAAMDFQCVCESSLFLGLLPSASPVRMSRSKTRRSYRQQTERMPDVCWRLFRYDSKSDVYGLCWRQQGACGADQGFHLTRVWRKAASRLCACSPHARMLASPRGASPVPPGNGARD